MAARKTSISNWFLGALFLVFLVLKLTGAIHWSWWWVTAPLWAPVAFVLVTLAALVWAARTKARDERAAQKRRDAR